MDPDDSPLGSLPWNLAAFPVDTLHADPAFRISALPLQEAPLALPTPADPCAPCGACCRTFAVQLSGFDVWRISTGQGLPPEAFVHPHIRGEQGPGEFHLYAHGPSYRLLLAKNGPFAPGIDCRFLAAQPDGTSRCGIYPDRPSACRTYPMGIWSGLVFQRAHVLCPPGAWPPGEPARPGWRRALHETALHFDLYHEVVARWNASVAAASEPRALADYYSYLLDVYTRLAAFTATLDPAAWAEIVVTWPPVPRADAQFVTARRAEGGGPWRDYLWAARAIIDQFFPAIPSLPFLLGTIDDRRRTTDDRRRAADADND